MPSRGSRVKTGTTKAANLYTLATQNEDKARPTRRKQRARYGHAASRSLGIEEAVVQTHERRNREDRRDESVSDAAYLDLVRDDPTLSAASKRLYVSKLKILAQIVGKDINWMLRNADATLVALRDYLARDGSNRPSSSVTNDPAAPTVRSYCSSVTALFKRLPPETLDDIGSAARMAWQKCHDDAKALVRDKYDNWRASDRQRDNFVPWEDLVAKRDELGADLRERGSRAHLILSFLTYLPPMRTSDLGSLRLFDHPSRRMPRFKTVAEKEAAMSTWNYVALYKNGGTLVINEYKTAKHYRALEEARKKAEHNATPPPSPPRGSRVCVANDVQADEKRAEEDEIRRRAEIAIASLLHHHQHPPTPCLLATAQKGAVKKASRKGNLFGHLDENAAQRKGALPRELFDILKESSRERPRDWVFVDCSGKPYQEASFNKMVSLELAATFDGKALSVNLIRHAAAIWLDQHHRHDAEMLRYFRYWMMHSRAMQGEYVLANNMVHGTSIAEH